MLVNLLVDPLSNLPNPLHRFIDTPGHCHIYAINLRLDTVHSKGSSLD